MTGPERQEILGLLERSYEGWPAAAIGASDPGAYLDWKIEGAPGARSTIVEGRIGGRLVAYIVQLDMPTLIEGRLLRGHLGADAAVDPDYRGRGIDAARRSFQVANFEGENEVHYTYSTNRTIIRGSQSVGDKPLGNVPQTLVRVLDWRRADVRAGGGRLGVLPGVRRAAAAGAAAWAHAIAQLPRPQVGSFALTTVPAFDERLDDFATDVISSFTLAVIRGRERMNWRYADPRAGPFRIRIAEAQGAMLGFAVTKVVGGRADVADLLAEPGRLDVADALLADALGSAREQDASSIGAYLPRRHPYWSVFRRHGFLSTRRSAGISIRSSLDVAKQSAFRAPTAALHITKGDFDAV